MSDIHDSQQKGMEKLPDSKIEGPDKAQSEREAELMTVLRDRAQHIIGLSESTHHLVDTLGNFSQSIFSLDEVTEEAIPRIGRKAANLVLLRKAGLPVPPGYCITTDIYDYFIENGKLPDDFVSQIIQIKKNLEGRIAIRSSANCEDGPELSMAGVFQSHYVYEDESIAIAIEQIFNQARSREVAQFMAIHDKAHKSIKMGLIIQKLIVPETAGVIYAGVNGDNLLVQYVDGFGANLADGKAHGSSIIVNKNGMILESTGFESKPLPPTVVNQILRHCRVIEDLFPGMPQDIEFACRDDTVHIVQARDLTTDLGKVVLQETPRECLEATRLKIRRLMAEEKAELGTPTAIFSDANYSEFLPRPAEMDIGLHMYTWGGSDGIQGAKQIGHSVMGYHIGPEATGVISYLGGRPYSSIGRYAALYHADFPETKEEYFATLVTEYLEAIRRDPAKGSYPQIGLFLQDPTLADLSSRYGDRAEEYFKIYQEFTVKMRQFARDFLAEFKDERCPRTNVFIKAMGRRDFGKMDGEQLLEHANAILEDVRTNSHVDFVKGARLGFYYSQRLQNLLRQRLGCNQDEAQKLYSKLNQGLDGSAITEANIAIAEAVSEDEALILARNLVGHFSTGEMLEIHHKPLRDDPHALQTYTRGIRQTGNYRTQFETQKAERIQIAESLLTQLSGDERTELEEVITASQTYMALRETAKYLVAKQYLLLRDVFEEMGKRFGMEKGDIYFLYPRELEALVSDPHSMSHLIRSRKQSFRNYQAIEMPHVITESNIDQITLRSNNETDFEEAVGKFLAEGAVVEGVIVNIDEFGNLQDMAELMKQYQLCGTPIILAGTQMNLSHDPFIAQAAGLAIENAGIVAHGAQRARELGKGAIGGIKSKQLKTGMRVLFDSQKQIIRKMQQ